MPSKENYSKRVFASERADADARKWDGERLAGKRKKETYTMAIIDND
jgi:hypothetical protein